MNASRDKTVIQPQPGRTRGDRAAPSTAGERDGGQALGADAPNPLIGAASTLFGVVTGLRHSTGDEDLDSLRKRLVAQVQRFDERVRQYTAKPETVIAARYCVCALVDEAVMKTSWGSASEWSSRSLLSTFHNETWGGEKFFLILDRLREEPARHLELLELLYVCLRLGFEGQYLVLNNGHARLETLTDEVYRSIRLQRGEGERELSPQWAGERDPRARIARYVPLWVVAAICGAVLVGMFGVFRHFLLTDKAPVMEALRSVSETTTNAGEDAADRS